MSSIPACPQCTLENTYPDGDNYVCADCGFEWPQAVAESGDEDGERIVKDASGNVLQSGDSVTLSARVRGDKVEVCVQDTGPGIAQADLAHLFDRFYQARQSVAPATGAGGKGLGLAIVKRIAELHGGDVQVDSAPGRGTRVTLVLPSVIATRNDRSGEEAQTGA